MIFWPNKEVVETYIIFRQDNLFRSLFASGDGVYLGSEDSRKWHQVKRKLQVTGDLISVSEEKIRLDNSYSKKKKKREKSEGEAASWYKSKFW